MATAQMYAPQGRRLPIHFQHEMPFSAAGVRAMRAGVPIGAGASTEAESLVVVDTGVDSAAREREQGHGAHRHPVVRARARVAGGGDLLGEHRDP